MRRSAMQAPFSTAPLPQTYSLVKPIINFSHPALRQPTARNDAKSSGRPEAGTRRGDGVDRQPESSSPLLPSLNLSTVARRLGIGCPAGILSDAQPLSTSPDHVEAAHAEQARVGRPGQRRETR